MNPIRQIVMRDYEFADSQSSCANLEFVFRNGAIGWQVIEKVVVEGFPF